MSDIKRKKATYKKVSEKNLEIKIWKNKSEFSQVPLEKNLKNGNNVLGLLFRKFFFQALFSEHFFGSEINLNFCEQ